MKGVFLAGMRRNALFGAPVGTA